MQELLAPVDLMFIELCAVRGHSVPIPVAARSKAWVYGHLLAGIVSSNTAGGMDVCLLAGTGLCVGLITHPEESHRV